MSKHTVLTWSTDGCECACLFSSKKVSISHQGEKLFDHDTAARVTASLEALFFSAVDLFCGISDTLQYIPTGCWHPPAAARSVCVLDASQYLDAWRNLPGDHTSGAPAR